jgi:acyl carrier protein
MPQISFEQVRDFVSEKLNVPNERLNPSTRLLHDLWLDGDDAAGLLTDFAQHFSVDMAGLDFRRHFGSEMEAGIRWVLQKTLGAERLGYAPITLKDLVEAANRGRWLVTESAQETS